MKKLFTLLAFIITLSASAQTDSVINYTDSLVYRIDTTIIVGDDTITSDSSFVRYNYHFINPDGVYEDQFVIIDSTGRVLIPIQAMADTLSSNGTVLRIKLNATQIGWTPEQLRDSLFYPIIQYIYGSSNVYKL